MKMQLCLVCKLPVDEKYNGLKCECQEVTTSTDSSATEQPMTAEKKPLKVKPHFYSVCFVGLQQIARDMGYNLLIHGSMNRDMDLVAVPWIDEPKSHFELLTEFSNYLGTKIYDSIEFYHPSILTGNRSSYIINLFRGEIKNSQDYQAIVYADDSEKDAQYYLDISITPSLSQQPKAQEKTGITKEMLDKIDKQVDEQLEKEKIERLK